MSRQLYLPDTAILVTWFMTPDGVGEVQDFMPIAGDAATDRHRLVRNIRVVRGVMRFAIEVQPRFDARKPHKVEITEYGVVFASDGLELTMHGIAPEGTSVKDLGAALQHDGGGLRWTRTLREGEIGSTGEQLGNFPQAFSHLSLISAAINLDHQLDYGPGMVGQGFPAR